MAFGVCDIEITGVNLDKAVKLLYKHGVRVSGAVRAEPKRLSLRAYTSAKKLFAIFSGSCYNLTIRRRYDLPALFAVCLKRAGLLIGMIAAAAVIAVYASSVREIRIVGNERVPETEIRAALSDLQIGVGTPIAAINPTTAEGGIVAHIPLLAAASVELHGVRLTVRVIERAETLPNDTAPRDLYAKRPGTVTGVIIIRGTALVKPGDKVTAGQLLIEGRIKNADDSYEYVRAEGTVLGSFEQAYTENFACEVETPYRTGETKEFSYLRLFGLTFPQNATFNPAFAEFESETTSRYLFDSLLPFERVTTVYYEIDRITETVDFEKVRKYVIQEAVIRARETVKSGELQSETVEVTDIEKAKLIAVKMVIVADLLQA